MFFISILRILTVSFFLKLVLSEMMIIRLVRTLFFGRINFKEKIIETIFINIY